MSSRNTNSVFFHRWLGIAALAPIIASGLLLVNCGGGGGRSAGGTGRFVLTIKWPEPSNSRLVPAASNSIKAVLTRGESTLGQKLLARPSMGANSAWYVCTVVPGLARLRMLSRLASLSFFLTMFGFLFRW